MYEVVLHGYNGPVAHDNIGDAITEVQSLLENEEETSITIHKTIMDEEKFKNLKEFTGY